MEIKTMIGAYMVTETSPQFGLRVYFVDKGKRCTCGQPHCRHVKAVAEYLKGGGERAAAASLAPVNASPASPVVPATCPICGAVVHYEAGSAVWRCTADPAHYWRWRGERGGVRAFLTGAHPAKAGAFYRQTLAERESFLDNAQGQMLRLGYAICP
jgi:hypothetical protein